MDEMKDVTRRRKDAKKQPEKKNVDESQKGKWMK